MEVRGVVEMGCFDGLTEQLALGAPAGEKRLGSHTQGEALQ